jgi:hypothetical protein
VGNSHVLRLPRKLVSRRQLIQILTRRIQRVPNGKIALRRVFRLSRPDENGCNWIFEIASPSNPSALYETLAGARFEFNLKEEEVEEA